MAATMPVIRRSLAEALLSCTHYESEESEHAAFGTALHDFHAAYTNLCVEANEESRLQDIDRLAVDAFWLRGGVDPGRLDEFKSLCDHFARTRLMRPATFMSVEQTLTLDVGWAILTCTVDRMDRMDNGDRDDPATEVLITDRKTEWPGYQTVEVEGEDGALDERRQTERHPFQMNWYVQERFLTMPSLSRVGFFFDYVRVGHYPENVTWFERGELDPWWADVLKGLQKKLAGPKGQPTGGNACQFCRNRRDCPMAISAAATAPTTPAEADQQLEEQLRLEEAIKLRKSQLKAFYADRDPRVAIGHEVGFQAPREKSFKVTGTAAQVKAWADEKGLEGIELLEVDKDALGAETRRQLVDAGLASFEYSAPSFKVRKAQSKKAVAA